MLDPILQDFPSEFTTERLLLRAPRPGDGPVLYEATCESLPALRAWPASLPWAIAEPSVAMSEHYCRTGAGNWLLRQDLPLLVFQADGRLVGSTGLHRMNWAQGSFEVGWWGRTADGGKGLMTEAIRAVCDFAFTKVKARRLFCLTDDLNARSCLLAERSGFVLEGVLRHERFDPDGQPRNSRLYAQTR